MQFLQHSRNYQSYRNKSKNLIDSTDDEKSIQKYQKKHDSQQKQKFKTQLCKNFSENSFCRYGKKCRFAHGMKQLNKNVQRNNLHYKSKKCNSFWNIGYCNYGSRCQFSHTEIQKSDQLLSICTKSLMLKKGDPSCSRLFTLFY